MSPPAGAVSNSPRLRVSARPSTPHRERLVDAARKAAGDISIVETGPTGIEEMEPLVMATVRGRTAFFATPDESLVRTISERIVEGTVPTDGSDAVVEHDGDQLSLPIPAEGPLAVGRRCVLGPCGWMDPIDPDDYDIVSTDHDAGGTVDVGLLGRGRGDAVADEPAATAWNQARTADGDPVVVVNGHETDDRPRADRTLLAGAPLSVLDGVAAIAEYIDATDVVVYLNEREDHLARRVRRAAETAADTLPIDPEVVAGPDEYRAGAPTAALEALEGAPRIEPRLQPPPPAEYGLYGRPTVIHTPRTLAQVRLALADPDVFDRASADPGTRLVTVTGDVDAPATVELPRGADLNAVQDAVTLDGSFKMACVGGVFGGLTRQLALAPTARSLSAAGLGTDGVVELLNDDRCMVATVGQRARFAAEENSGRCVPGREGTKQLTELLRDIYDGRYETDKIRELASVMRRSANCQIGMHAPRPVTSAMDEFDPEFRAHADGRCPSGTCTERL